MHSNSLTHAMLNTATPRRRRRKNAATIHSDPSIWVRSSCEARSLLLIHRYKLAGWVRQNCCERFKKLSKFIVDFEGCMQIIMALIELESALSLHSCISLTDNLIIKNRKTQ